MEPIIRVKNITTYFGYHKVLDNISIDFLTHEIAFIVGKSGCGKTTLLKHIIGLHRPADGDIEIFGENILAMDESCFNSTLNRIGVLFQNGALFNSITVKDNVSIPLEQHSDLPKRLIDRIVHDKLNLVGLGHALDLYPAQLSGGMRKRAALARAIALDPQILFADEPGAGLDPITAASIDNLLLNLRNLLDMTLVIVSHEINSIKRIADRIVFMDEGAVKYDGDFDKIKDNTDRMIKSFFQF
ncbi:ATP-binding cassette domain-containing protein [candidate division KSB1 bacterium]|nr:ATP-binding cassette domain-containing protein [candidate division KSB1 bacterium]